MSPNGLNKRTVIEMEIFGCFGSRFLIVFQITSFLSKNMKNPWETSHFRAQGTVSFASVLESATRIICKEIWEKNKNGYILYSWSPLHTTHLYAKLVQELSI